ncbi:MAG: peptidylprolyl isomerase [Bacteroidota bacterium]|jgi:cyclophilin family peptidyl-prolyl cis-trans isomerase
MKFILLNFLLCGITSIAVLAQDKNNNHPVYTITVQELDVILGDITIELFPETAHNHCANFDSLVKIGFYDGTAFHRIDPDFMIQGGDPNSKNPTKDPSTWGFGDESQKKIPAEFNSISHKRGILSAARGENINSADSQFFICVKDSEFLDGEYTAYGKVLQGMEIVDKVAESSRDKATERPLKKITMKIVKK